MKRRDYSLGRAGHFSKNEWHIQVWSRGIPSHKCTYGTNTNAHQCLAVSTELEGSLELKDIVRASLSLLGVVLLMSSLVRYRIATPVSHEGIYPGIILMSC